MNTTTQMIAEAYAKLVQAQADFRRGRISLADLNAARKAYNRAIQHDPDVFQERLDAGRKLVR